MPINSSSIVEDVVQPDGRRFIRERHTDHVARNHDFFYIANSGVDVTAILATRAIELLARLKQMEIEFNVLKAIENPLGGTGQMSLIYSTIDENGAFIRARFAGEFGFNACRLAKFLQTLTDAQIRNLFGITQGQVANLRSQLQVRIDKLNAVEAEVGG